MRVCTRLQHSLGDAVQPTVSFRVPKHHSVPHPWFVVLLGLEVRLDISMSHAWTTGSPRSAKPSEPGDIVESIRLRSPAKASNDDDDHQKQQRKTAEPRRRTVGLIGLVCSAAGVCRELQGGLL